MVKTAVTASVRAAVRVVKTFLHLALRPFLYMSAGGILIATIVAVLYLNNRPDLSVWHTTHLDEEFTAASGVGSLEDYLKLEDRLFSQLTSDVYDKLSDDQRTSVNRYNKGSKSDPGVYPKNWNRTFELPAENASFGVLLLHGMSDSPYSLRSLAEQFNADGGHALGLRIPGHGTAPSGLRHATFKDMAAAAELGMRYLTTKLAGRPIYIVGYSNGGALAVHYATRTILETDLPETAGLILLSPEIGITPAAVLAYVQAWLGEHLGLKKLAWNSIQPEFDPFKYGSFAVNAGIQAYEATKKVRAQLAHLRDRNLIGKMPPILAFQSAADSTVEAPVLVSELFDKLSGAGHELVVFDVNRTYAVQGLLAKEFPVGTLLEGAVRDYDVSIVTNKKPSTLAVEVRERAQGEDRASAKDIAMQWPEDVYSLTHIALPFAKNDPVCGTGDPESDQGHALQLGKLAIRGENNTLAIPVSALTRQRWNPFHDYLLQRTKAFIGKHQ